ncbi:MAG TPA: nitroreductase family deazaflavin-dependent oxidoreductase [Ilumatobacteraceae bacterium]|nr:nitroreductase family deazaflavin-dependent oxidoreductase [Ilumatobacteraceae bacterium]
MSKEPLDSAMDWVAEHTRKYVETGGDDGYMWRGFPTVVLTTTGRKSGDLRRNALIYGKDGDDFILIASYGGRPTHPLWYLNLVADPSVTIQERADVVNGVAETVPEGEERDRLWDKMVSIFPPYAEYQAKTERRIPVVRVRRAD